jgi:hypothetical protein
MLEHTYQIFLVKKLDLFCCVAYSCSAGVVTHDRKFCSWSQRLPYSNPAQIGIGKILVKFRAAGVMLGGKQTTVGVINNLKSKFGFEFGKAKCIHYSENSSCHCIHVHTWLYIHTVLRYNDFGPK